MGNGRMPTRTFSRLFGLALVALGFAACGQAAVEHEGSETHFLAACDGACGAGAECICGVCTAGCSKDAECSAMGSSAACVALAPRVDEGRCGENEPSALCDVSCLSTSNCAPLGGDFVCDGGFCRHGATSPAAPESRRCDLAPVSGAEVVVIGDALIELSVFTAALEAEATTAGVLASGDHFRDYAASATSWLADGSASITTQYATAESEGNARVVIMDGGATDFLLAPCGAAPTADCPQMQAAAAGAELLLSRFAEDGVEHVVYAFYADAVKDDTLKASLDVLRPLVENACGKSRVACHFLDLRPSFAGHPEYVGDPQGIVWTEAGANVAAQAVFGLMQERCVTGPR